MGSIRSWPCGAGLVGAALVAVASCSGAGAGEPVSSELSGITATPTGSDPSTSATRPSAPIESSPAFSVDPDDPRPAITYSYLSFQETFGRPVDLAQFYVYPDGGVIGVTSPEIADPFYSAYELSSAEFDQLLSFVADVDLTGGGLQPEVPLPDGVDVVDGGNGVFVSRINGQLTARIIEQPSEVAFSEDNTVPDRLEYLEFSRAFLPLSAQLRTAVDEDRDSLPLDRWAIVSAPLGPRGDSDSDAIWTGPDLNLVDWHVINGASLCTIVVDASWPLDPPYAGNSMVIDQRTVTRRPLLPHESTCDDIAEKRSVLELDDPATPGPADTDAHQTDRWTGGLDGPVIFGRDSGDAEMALAIGTIGLLEECMVIESATQDDVQRSLLVWAYGATWYPGSSSISVEVPQNPNRFIGIGDQVELGGGFHDPDSLSQFVTDTKALDHIEDCLADPSIDDIFVNQ